MDYKIIEEEDHIERYIKELDIEKSNENYLLKKKNTVSTNTEVRKKLFGFSKPICTTVMTVLVISVIILAYTIIKTSLSNGVMERIFNLRHEREILTESILPQDTQVDMMQLDRCTFERRVLRSMLRHAHGLSALFIEFDEGSLARTLTISDLVVLPKPPVLREIRFVESKLETDNSQFGIETLEQVHFERCSMDKTTFRSILKNFKNIKSLLLTRCNFSFMGGDSHSELHIGEEIINEENLKKMPQLEYIRIEYYSENKTMIERVTQIKISNIWEETHENFIIN